MVERTYPASIVLFMVLAASPISASPAETGAAIDVARYRGKVVVLDFWASWCVPCRRSIPWLNAMHEKYADDGLVIIGVNVDQEPEEAAAFLRQYPAKFMISYDSQGKVARLYGVQGMPTSFVLGRDGEVIAQHLGFKVKRQDEYEAALVAALKQEQVE